MPAGCWGQEEVAEVRQLGDGTAARLVIESSERDIGEEPGESESVDIATGKSKLRSVA